MKARHKAVVEYGRSVGENTRLRLVFFVTSWVLRPLQKCFKTEQNKVKGFFICFINLLWGFLIWFICLWIRSPSLWACVYPIFQPRRFHRPIYFKLEFISKFRSPQELQWQSEARTYFDMPTWCRHVHVRPHCFILIEACSCTLELTYFAVKYLKIDWSVKMPLPWLIMGVAGS